MRKVWYRLFFCLLAVSLIWCGSVIRDREALNDGLIRLHVVGASDSQEDQQLKLRVRDAVLRDIRESMGKAVDAKEAERYLAGRLPRLKKVANDTLASLGSGDRVKVSLCRESFPVRHYDTFTLPSGVYESLRIRIGEGRGHNWWCVAFPALCLPAAAEQVDAVAADAGFSRPLRGTILEKDGCSLRFYFLDLLGRLQSRDLH